MYNYFYCECISALKSFTYALRPWFLIFCESRTSFWNIYKSRTIVYFLDCRKFSIDTTSLFPNSSKYYDIYNFSFLGLWTFRSDTAVDDKGQEENRGTASVTTCLWNQPRIRHRSQSGVLQTSRMWNVCAHGVASNGLGQMLIKTIWLLIMLRGMDYIPILYYVKKFTIRIL